VAAKLQANELRWLQMLNSVSVDEPMDSVELSRSTASAAGLSGATARF
jgi:hypothetical protein